MARRIQRNFGRGISETQRRKKAWIDMNTQPATGNDISGSNLFPPTLVAAGDSLSLIQFPSQAGFQESTILRIRGSLMVPKSSYADSSNADAFAFGIGVVSDQAAENLAVPNPATATGYDWDGWLFLRQSPSAAVDVTGTIVDVKAMRKWKSGDSIVFVAGMATSSVGGLTGIAFEFTLRGLFLLP